jgi:hypothetical protein
MVSAWPEWDIETIEGALNKSFAGWNVALAEVASGARAETFEYENAACQQVANSFFEMAVELVKPWGSPPRASRALVAAGWPSTSKVHRFYPRAAGLEVLKDAILSWYGRDSLQVANRFQIRRGLLADDVRTLDS